MFVPRRTRPESGNPYYNQPPKGYAVGIIDGNPQDAGCDVLANCVGYAAGRFNEIIGRGCFVYWQYAPNPDQWIAAAKEYGLRIGSEPQLGAVLVWGHHVAIVEEINADGTIVTSESGYGCNNPFWLTTRNNDDGCWNGAGYNGFKGFIYQPKEDPMKKGIDISAYQTQVDWNKVQADFCIIQCWGGVVLGQPDTMYESHYAGAKSRGIPVGCYLFACAKTVDEAKKEADICISMLKGKQFEYPIFYDLERADILKTGKANVSAIIRAFLTKVEAAGYWVGLYCNPDVIVHYLEPDIAKRYSIWLAQYDVSAPTYPCGIWQPNTAQTAGFPEPVDQDICYIDYESQIKAKGLNGYGKPEPTPAPTPAKDTLDITIETGGKTYSGTLTEK